MIVERQLHLVLALVPVFVLGSIGFEVILDTRADYDDVQLGIFLAQLVSRMFRVLTPFLIRRGRGRGSAH